MTKGYLTATLRYCRYHQNCQKTSYWFEAAFIRLTLCIFAMKRVLGPKVFAGGSLVGGWEVGRKGYNCSERGNQNCGAEGHTLYDETLSLSCMTIVGARLSPGRSMQGRVQPRELMTPLIDWNACSWITMAAVAGSSRGWHSDCYE
ncbi:hypothetical protein PV05_04328 [Exophiala xenobiotica]|uniref:Uncharacterized protein n=1 Tax=Exophiala xenobiotica TaxID=348802 RepID=A0A0D2EJK9_9EURO|nr:uncharacterized protein PV05_04328 [Exophiala xenobiotica]KIW55598.1 hypothetical protein PV05_04328 [Exophiala xenobiotica]